MQAFGPVTNDADDPFTELRASIDLLRFSMDAMNSTMKGVLQEMRVFEARIRALEGKAAPEDPGVA